MKLISFTSLLLLFLTLAAIGQNPGKLSVGLKGGINVTSVHNPEESTFKADPKIGFAGGVFLSLPLGKYTGIQTEILFSQRKILTTGKMPDDQHELIRTADYIDLPMFFSVSPTPFLTMLAGPQYAFLINKEDLFKRSAVTEHVRDEFEREQIRRHTLCLVLGGDVKYSRFVISLRLGWDLLSNNITESTSVPQYSYIWSQVTLGYEFY